MNGPRARRGGVAMIVAAAALPLLVAVGLAVDLTRLYVLNSRLVSATDAAALAGARAMFDTDRDDQVRAWFWANFGRRSTTAENANVNQVGYLDSIVPPLRITPGTSPTTGGQVLRVEASATLPTTFMGLAALLRVPGQFATMTTRADQSAERRNRGMELSLVLDVTGSMAGASITALRSSASEMVNSLYGGKETVDRLSVAVVPYVASVNIGRGHEDWLKAGSLRQTDYASTAYPWRGCVEARHLNGEDQTDTPPGTAPFQPYLWRSTYNKDFAGQGDNDWIADAQPGTDNYKYRITEPSTESPPSDSQQNSLGNNTVGPNLSCPRAIRPLTRERSVVLNEIASLRAMHRGGTMANLGLQMGWATLSPRWRGLWGTADSPRDYGTRFVDKVLVLMTDGANAWNDDPRKVPVTCAAGTTGCVNGYRMQDDADYTAYGRLSENRLGLATNNNSRAGAEVDRRMSLLCTSIKARGIIVYTITFNLTNTTAQALYRNCATRPELYFNSPDSTSLRAAFREIAGQLANLSLTQ